MNESNFDQISRIAQGHAAFQFLRAGIELGLFTLLSKQGPLTDENITAALHLESQPAKILLQGLTSLNLLTYHQERYSCSPMTQEYLLPESPNNMIDVMGWQHHIVYPGIMDFTESLRQNTNVGLRRFPGTENNLYARLAHDPTLETVFQKAMSSLSRASHRHLMENAELTGIHHLVDVGGGAATNAIALCRKHPHLRVTVFDSPSVCELAKKNIREAQLDDRIGVHPGDLFTTPFPEGFDGVLLSHMLTIWSPDKNIALLERIFAALPEGGKVIVFNMMTQGQGNGPISCTLGSAYFMSVATGQGMLYSSSEQEDFLKAAGFKSLKLQRVPLDHALLVGQKSPSRSAASRKAALSTMA